MAQVQQTGPEKTRLYFTEQRFRKLKETAIMRGMMPVELISKAILFSRNPMTGTIRWSPPETT